MAQLTLLQRMRITPAVRLEWYRALAALCADGFPLFDALRAMEGEFKRLRHPLVPVVSELVLRMRGSGSNTRTATNGRQRTVGSHLLGLVPTNEATLIEAGERSGDMANGFERAADFVEANARLQGTIRTLMIGPALLILLLIAIQVFFSLKILPTFAEISPRVSWPSYARLYGTMADLAIPIGIGAVILFAALTVGYGVLSRKWTGSMRRWLDRRVWPFTGTAQINSAAMLASLASFVKAGVPFAEAIETLGRSSGPFMRTVYTAIAQELREGKRPHDALLKAHIVNQRFHWLLKLYGQTSDFSGSMSRLSSMFIEAAIKRTTQVFGVISFLVKLAIVGFVAWTMATMFGIVGGVKNSHVIGKVEGSIVIYQG